jgi:hypothetical protein
MIVAASMAVKADEACSIYMVCDGLYCALGYICTSPCTYGDCTGTWTVCRAGCNEMYHRETEHEFWNYCIQNRRLDLTMCRQTCSV